jgi:hypothetical protein
MSDRWLEEQVRNPVHRLTELMNRRDPGDHTADDYEALRQRLLGQ